MIWTSFMDMHSGGGQKLEWAHIFIEGGHESAVARFSELFSRDPRHVTCGCCGEDFAVHEHETLEQATAYERGCAWDKAAHGYVERCDQGRSYVTLAEFEKREDVKIVREVSP